MGDYLDKETKQFLLIFAGIMLFLFFIYPKISGNLLTADFSNQISPLLNTNSSNAITKIDSSKDYSAKVTTSFGAFNMDLFEKSAPKNVANFISNVGVYGKSDVVTQKDFLIKVDVKNEPNIRVEDEINADYLLLDRIKVKDAKFLAESYDANDAATKVYAPDNLSKYNDFTLKEFYSSVLKYKFNPDLTTPKAAKYMVYMASNAPDQNKVDFFVLTTGNAPQVDGRYTPIGQVTSGFDIVDQINTASGIGTVTQITIEAK